jgi:hypothetical protein
MMISATVIVGFLASSCLEQSVALVRVGKLEAGL